MLAIGDILQSRYRVVRQLGHGGMGTVYEAHDERFEISVALKEVLIDLAKIADPVQQQMVARAFEREAKTLAQLHHEAFPHVIDYFSERDHQYLIMELIRGEDLGEQLQKRKKPFEFEDVLEWTKQLLDALDYLHTQEQPIIHRDLKPQNMKITARGKVKVLDFGIAKGADNKSSSTITNQTFVAATLNYSPIEQLLRVLDPTFREFISQRHQEKVEDILEHTADARSDLYSLGATLYQLLTATQPHDTLKRALDIWGGKPDPLPNPIELNPKIPPYFNQILLKSMEIDRDSRFVSAAEMQQVLLNYLDAETRGANQAIWLAEQQQQPAPPEAGMQTQIRIAEELKFLDELSSPAAAKTEVLPPLEQTPAAPPTASFVPPPVNAEEERRRIAEQQKFLAELDTPAPAPAAPQTPVRDSALTDYGQITPPFNPQAAEQTNYAVNAPTPSPDQTQVSYLDGVLPAQQAKAADSTVINPQIRTDVPPPAPAEPVAESKPSNKLLWLIPVGAFGLFLLVGVIGVLAYVLMPTPEQPQPQPAPVEGKSVVSDNTPVENLGGISSDNNSNVDKEEPPVITSGGGSKTPVADDNKDVEVRSGGNKPKQGGGEVRTVSDRPKPTGDRPKPAGDKPKPAGDKPKPAGDKPKPGGSVNPCALMPGGKC
jgi:serine/threonine protein kinase